MNNKVVLVGLLLLVFIMLTSCDYGYIGESKIDDPKKVEVDVAFGKIVYDRDNPPIELAYDRDKLLDSIMKVEIMKKGSFLDTVSFNFERSVIESQTVLLLLELEKRMKNIEKHLGIAK